MADADAVHAILEHSEAYDRCLKGLNSPEVKVNPNVYHQVLGLRRIHRDALVAMFLDLEGKRVQLDDEAKLSQIRTAIYNDLKSDFISAKAGLLSEDEDGQQYIDPVASFRAIPILLNASECLLRISPKDNPELEELKEENEFYKKALKYYSDITSCSK